MSKRASLLETGLDRVRTTVATATKELRRVQKRVDAQRKTLEKRVATRRKALEKRASSVLDQVRESSLVKTAEALRLGATRQIEARVESVLGVLQIPTRSELERIDRRLSQISRKLKDLERGSSVAA